MITGDARREPPPPGTQTLARGLTALQLIADADGMSVQEVAESSIGAVADAANEMSATLS
jgi:hypothetical protein